ncbi:hypothetical protein RRG08_055639 [Elysia crispata]|uniref:Uncharacterized protein n=1 Tax=Elysia crispata TaxID=231223 RepID=A0AAE1DBE4_9GAST|nr:hypothetical protein RRG08_055639 [Elysia crispata]
MEDLHHIIKPVLEIYKSLAMEDLYHIIKPVLEIYKSLAMEDLYHIIKPVLEIYKSLAMEDLYHSSSIGDLQSQHLSKTPAGNRLDSLYDGKLGDMTWIMATSIERKNGGSHRSITLTVEYSENGQLYHKFCPTHEAISLNGKTGLPQ